MKNATKDIFDMKTDSLSVITPKTANRILPLFLFAVTLVCALFALSFAAVGQTYAVKAYASEGGGYSVRAAYAENETGVVSVQFGDAEPTVYDTMLNAYQAIINNAENSGKMTVTIKLLADVMPEIGFNMYNAIQYPTHVSWKIVFDFNGYVMDNKNVKDDHVFGIGSSELKLTDSAPDRTHTGDYTNFPKGGILTGMKSATNGVILILGESQRAKLIMESGTVIGNYGSGQIVFLMGNSDFIMTGGAITGNGIFKQSEDFGVWNKDITCAVYNSYSCTASVSGIAKIDGNYYRETDDGNRENGIYTSGIPCNFYSADTGEGTPSPLIVGSGFTGKVSVVSRRLPEAGRPIKLVEFADGATAGDDQIAIESENCFFEKIGNGLWVKKKVNFAALSSPSEKFYIDDGMPSLTAAVTDAQTGNSVPGAIKWDGSPVAGQIGFGYTFTPDDTDTYQTKITGDINVTCVGIEKFEIRGSDGRTYVEGDYLDEIAKDLSLHKIYTDKRDVTLNPSEYTLTLKSGYKQLLGGENTILFTYAGVKKELTLTAQDKAVAVWACNASTYRYETFEVFDNLADAVKYANESSKSDAPAAARKKKIVLNRDFGGDVTYTFGQASTTKRTNVLTETIVINEGAIVQIDLNGHILDGSRINRKMTYTSSVHTYPDTGEMVTTYKFKYTETAPMLLVYGSLSIFDSRPEKEHADEKEDDRYFPTGGVLTGLNAHSCVVVDGANASFTLNGGTIYRNGSSGNNASGWGYYTDNKQQKEMWTSIQLPDKGYGWFDTVSGGGVRVVNNAEFTLSGGTVSRNNAQSGGGVYLESGAVTVLSGKIVNNNNILNYSKPWEGGGVYIKGGYFTMTGGEITDNGYCKDNGTGLCTGAGVYQYAGTADIFGGKIVNPKGENMDYYWNSGTLTLSGSTEIGCIDFRKMMITIKKEFTGSFKVSAWDGVPEWGTPVPIVYFTGGGVHSYNTCSILPYNAEDCEVIGVDDSRITNYAYYVAKRHKSSVSAETDGVVYPGDPLPDLKITSDTPGCYSWNYEIGEVRVPVGGRNYSYTFTPYDTINYKAATYWIRIVPLDVTGITAELVGAPELYTSATPESLAQHIEVYAHFEGGEPKKLTDFKVSFAELSVGSNNVFISANYASADWAASLALDFAEVKPTELSAACNQGDVRIFTSTKITELKTLLAGKIVVTSAFNDGIAREITDYTLSGDLSRPGAATITLSYGGLSAEFTVDVSEVGLSSISAAFDAGNNKIRTDFGDEKLMQYLTVFGTNNDGSPYLNGAAIPAGELTLTHEPLTAGDNTVTVTYMGAETTFTVTAVTITALSAALNQGDIAVYPTTEIDTLLKIFGNALTVTATYSDESQGTPEDYSLSGDLTSAGGATAALTVTCGGKTANFDVAVTAVVPIKIEVAFKQGSIKVYTTTALDGLKEILGSALTVTATYNDGAFRATDDFTLSGDISESGSRLITVTCGTATGTFYLYVNRTVMTELTVEFNQGETSLYSNFSAAKIRGLIENAMTVTAIYSDGTPKTVTDYGFSGTATAGDAVPFTVSYGGMSKTVNLEIIKWALASIRVDFDQNGHAVYTSTTVADFRANACGWFKITVSRTYNDGSVSTSDDFDGLTLSGGLSTAGDITFTAAQDGVISNGFTVTVTKVALGSVTAVFDPKWNIINTNNTPEDLRQFLTVTAAYNDGTLYNGGYPFAGYAISGDLSKAGTATVTVTVTDDVTGSKCDGTFTVEVVTAAPATLTVRFKTSGPVFTSSSLDDLKERIEVTAKYADGSDYNYGNPISDYTLAFQNGATAFAEGKNTIVASWNGLSVEFSAEAVKADLDKTSIKITYSNPYNDIIYTRWGLDKLLPYIKVTAKYTDGTDYAGGTGLGGVALSYKGDATSIQEGQNTVIASFGGVEQEVIFYAFIPAATVRVDGGEEVCYSLFSESWFRPLNSEGKTVRITLYKDIVGGAAGASGGTTQRLTKISFTGSGCPKEVILDLNGHIIDYNKTESDPLTDPWLFDIAGTSFVITDSDPDAAHDERLASEASFPTGGVICGAYIKTSSSYVGFIRVGKDASFRLDGGTVYKNTAVSTSTYGALPGTVRLDGGTFTMNGGAIIGNVLAWDWSVSEGGAGVEVGSGTFVMNGGVIEGNEGSGTFDAQVHLKGGNFMMTGGRIASDAKTEYCVDVDCPESADASVNVVFTMSGGEIEAGNKQAVYVKYRKDKYSSGRIHYGTFNLRGGTIHSTYYSGVKIAERAKMNLSGNPTVDAVIYLYYNGNGATPVYSVIMVDGAFGGTLKSVFGRSSNDDSDQRKVIEVTQSGSILPSASIGAQKGDPRYALNVGEDGNVYQIYALLDPVVNPVLSGTFYIDGELPAISLSAGDTAGEIGWITNVDSKPNTYYWKFTPDAVKINGSNETIYKTVYGEITLVPVDITKIEVRYNGADTLFEGKTLSSLKSNFTVYVLYANGDERKLSASDFTLSLIENGTVLTNTKLAAGENTVRITYTNPQNQAKFTADVTIMAEKIVLSELTARVSNHVFLVGTTLETLPSYFTVTAYYNDGTSKTVSNGTSSGGYTLSLASGETTLVEGENTVIVSYEGINATVTVSALVPTVGVKVGESSHEQYFDTLTAAWAAVQGKTATLTLYQDFVTTEWLVVKSGTTLTLDLNGHILDRNLFDQSSSVANGCVIRVQGASGSTQGAKLILTDGNSTADHADRPEGFPKGGVITGGNMLEAGAGVGGGGISVLTGGTLRMKGGTIYRNRTSGSGGGIWCYDGGTIIDGGAVLENYAAKNGGGIYTQYSIYLESIDIYGNTAKWKGGGIFANFSGITAEKTKIYGNNSEIGGGIYGGSMSYSIELTDCEVYGNNATENVGGMYVRKGFEISGSTRIENNCVSGQYNDARGYYTGGTKSNVGMIWADEKMVTVRGVFTGKFSVSSIGEVETVSSADPLLPTPGNPITGFISVSGTLAESAVIELDIPGYKLIKTESGFDLAADGQAPQVQPVVTGKLYIDGSLPALTLPDGATVSGTFTWLDTTVYVGAHAYRWRFTPTDLEAYRVVEGETILTAISIIGLNIEDAGGQTPTSTDLDTIKARLTARIAYADGTFGRTLNSDAWTLNFSGGQTALTEGGNALTAKSSVAPDTEFIVVAEAVAPAEITAAIKLETVDENGETVPVTVYDSWTLSELAKYITVTGKNNDGSDINSGNPIKGFSLSGALNAGSSVITVEYGGATATLTVDVQAAGLTGLTLLFDPGDKVFSTNDTPEALRLYLAVMAIYGNIEKKVLDYELPNQRLVAGNNEIEVAYGEMTKTFTVNAVPDEFLSLKITENPSKTNYNAFENFDRTGLKISAVFSVSGEREITDFTVTNGGNLRFGTTFVTISFTYEGVTRTADVGVTVAKIVYDMTGIAFVDGAAIYDGKAHGLAIGGTLPTGCDGIALSVRYEGNATDAGSYTIRAIFTTTSENYIVPEAMTATLTIDPKTVEIVWAADDFTYNGADQKESVTAQYVDVFGNSVSLSVTGDAFKEWCANGYTFTAAFATEAKNYVLPDAVTKNYTMKKRALTVTAKDTTITYGAMSANNGAEFSGFTDGEGLSDLNGSLTFSYTYVQFGDAGTYAITPSGLTGGNYEISFVGGVLTVKQAPLTVTIDSKRSAKGDDLLALTARVTGTVYNGDTVSYTLSSTADKIVAESVDITGADTDKNYAITFINGTYEVYSIDAYLAFTDSYGALIGKTPGSLAFADIAEIGKMYAAYTMLNIDNANRLTDTERTAIAALKNKADALSAAKSAADTALGKLDGVTGAALRGELDLISVKNKIQTATDAAAAYAEMTTGVSTHDLDGYANLAAAQKAVEDYEAYLEFEETHGSAYGKTPGALTYPETSAIDAMAEAFGLLSEGEKAVFTDAERANISALIDKSGALKEKKADADTALGALADAVTGGADKETLQNLLADAGKKTGDFIAENGEVADIEDYDALQNAEIKISDYEKTEIAEKIESDIGASEDWTNETVGGFTVSDIPEMENVIDKIEDALDKIDNSSDMTKDALADKRVELETLKNRIGSKLELETAKAAAIAELDAERERVLSSGTYTASAKREIDAYYDEAIQKIMAAAAISSVGAEKANGIETLGSVEQLHVGWLITDLLLAALILGEAGYLLLRKRKSCKKGVRKTYSFVPIGLLAAVQASGWAAGVAFFVILLLTALILGIWIADAVLRDKGKKNPFAPIIDKFSSCFNKIVAFVKTAKKAKARATEKESVAATENQTALDTKRIITADETADAAESAETSSEQNTATDATANVTVAADKKVYIRYDFSFRAKLIQAPTIVQQRYIETTGALRGVKSKTSWWQERFYIGRKTVATVLFRGRTLCLALALDPKTYIGTKYRGEDMSEVKRYAKTPYLIKLNSDRKAKSAKELIGVLLGRNGVEPSESDYAEFSMEYRTTDELIAAKLVKVFADGETNGGEFVKANVGELIRKKISLGEAQTALSDEVAATLIERIESEQSNKITGCKESQEGGKRGIVNIDTLSENFDAGDTVNLETLKQKGLIANNVTRLKILARGTLDKALSVVADDFSLDAVKMIVLTGGKAIKKFKYFNLARDKQRITKTIGM